MIKKILDTSPQPGLTNIILLILRLSALLLFLNHGLSKFTNLVAGGEIKFGDPIGLGPEMSFILVVFAEFFCSLLIVVGLGTRFAAIPLIINFLVIIFVVHLHDPLSRKELPLFYLISFVSLLIIGGGKYSLDYLLFNKTDRKSTAD